MGEREGESARARARERERERERAGEFYTYKNTYTKPVCLALAN